MKLFSAIAAAAVIGGSFLIPNPAEARNGWVKVGCGSQSGQCVYVKVIGRNNYPIVKYLYNGKNSHTMEAHCQKWATRFVNDNGTRDNWKDVMPQSLGEAEVETVCR
jgi:hypothetical protein